MKCSSEGPEFAKAFWFLPVAVFHGLIFGSSQAKSLVMLASIRDIIRVDRSQRTARCFRAYEHPITISHVVASYQTPILEAPECSDSLGAQVCRRSAVL
jgi:hypothetical protein